MKKLSTMVFALMVCSLGLMAQNWPIGAPDPSIGTTSSSTLTNHFMIFDVLAPSGVVIDSLDLYPTGAVGSPFTIVIQDNLLAVVTTYSGVTTVTGGALQRVKVDLTLPPGTGYRLGFTTNPGMTRNTTGAIYPYVVPNVMTITGNTFDVVYYYFFYNLRVKLPLYYPNDAGISAITSPTSPTLPGVSTVVATIFNYGTTNLTSANIGWSVNGVLQTSNAWMGNLAPATAQAAVVLGTYNFTNGVQTIQAWTSMPNGGVDSLSSNDTATSTIMVCTPLFGNYSIGTGGDFPDIPTAINGLLQCGISGPVTFNALPNSGPYIGGIEIGSIPGTSSTNTVTINGNGNVINEGSSSYIIGFNGASYITLNDFQIINSNPSVNKFGILIRGASQYINITNNYIDMGMATTSSAAAGIVASNSLTSATSAGSNGQFITISGNEIVGGYYGISLNGNSSYLDCNDITIDNNLIKDFYFYGIRFSNVENAMVSGNDISRPTRSTISTYYGVYLTTSRNVKINGNLLHTTGIGSYTTYPIYITTSVNNPGFETEIVNNVIYNMQSTSTVYGIYLLGTRDYINVYHNTVHLVAEGSGAKRAFFASTALTNHNILNNIFSVQGAGTGAKHCIYISNITSTTLVSDFNDFYMGATAGTNNLGYWGSANQSTLANWQQSSQLDAMSIDTDPAFYATDDFRCNGLSVYQTGTPIPSVTNDIFGTPRNPMAPCMGAFEFILYQRDAGITQMTEPIASCPGLANVKVKIKNWGIQPFTGATIDWSINGLSQAPYVYTNTLAVGAEEEVNLGSYNFQAGISYDFVFYSSNPGGQADQNPVNDTLVFSGYRTAMNGVYTIGPALTDDFSSIEGAVNALVSYGVCGPVTFNVAANSGPYTGGIQIPAIAGSSAINTIIFNGNGNVVNEATQSYIIGFNGSSYITLDNFDIINTVPATAKYGIHITGGSQYITITNCMIDAGNVSTSTASGGIIVSGSPTAGTTAGNNGQYLTISNNEIVGGYYGITLIGNASYLDGIQQTVTHNIVRDFYSYGIYLSNIDGAVVENNELSRANRPTFTTLYGIYLSSSRDVKARNNRIYNTGAASYSAYPVYVTTSVNLPGAETEFVNNLIYNIPTTSTLYGIYMLGTREYVNIYHNSVYLNPSGAGTVRAVFFSTAPNLHNMKNNIFSIEGDGTGTKHLIYNSATSTSFYSDHNVLYMGATAGTNYLGYWTTNQAALPDWQMNTMLDLGSNEANPVFANTAIGNLTPLSGSIDNMGFPLGIMDDFYGNPRSPVTPDPGAIEFTGITADISLNSGKLLNSLCLSANDTVGLVITNTIGTTIDFSNDPLTATWMVSGPVNSTANIIVNNGTLAPNTSMTITGLGVNLSLPGTYVLSAYILPSSKNLFTGNDTITDAFELDILVPFEVIPAQTLITNTTDTLVLEAKSTFFPAGAFFMTEICHYRGSSTGAPSGGWPSYLTADDYIEITGVPNSDLAGYTLEQWSTSALLSTFTFPVGTLLSPSGTAIIAVGEMGSSVPSPANYYYHGNGTYTGSAGSTGAAGRILKDPSNTIIDAVGYGTYTFPAAAGVTTNDWSGNTPAVSSAGNRLVGPYTKDATNWINSGVSPQDPNTVNNMVTVPTPANLSGLTWSFMGFVMDTNVTDIVVGPFAADGVYEFVASYVTPCGILTDTATIVVQLLSVFGDTTICAGDSALIGAYLPGTPPFTIVVTDGTGTDTLPGIPMSPFAMYMSPTTTTTYTLLSYWDASGIPIPANASVTITVNPLPVVALAPLSPVCIDAAPITLSGGTPSGGTYSGTGVATGVFNPATAGAGTHVITYTYTDLNSCTNSATINMVVNPLPVVAFAGPSPVCINAAPFTLSGGTPLGGTYAGPGVSSGTFNPALAGQGTHVITYAYTDANGCAASATASVTVNALPVVSLALFDTVCDYHAPFALTGGLPAGGTYSGTGVSAGVFNPAVANLGMHTITYSYTDPATGCSAMATDSIFVDPCVGINGHSADISLSVFPNPAQDEINIDINGISRPMDIRVLNLVGQEMYREHIEASANSFRRTLDVGKYPAGLYYIRLESGSFMKVQKVVVLE